MSGKKTVKKTSKFTLAEQLENNFKTIPAKISRQYRDDITSIKKSTDKVKNNLMKMQNSMKMAQKKASDLAMRIKQKKSSTIQKQLNLAKKTIEKTQQNIAHLTSKIALLQKQTKNLVDKQNRFAALAKAMAQVKKSATIKTTAPKPATTVTPAHNNWQSSYEIESDSTSDDPLDLNS